LSIQLTEEQVRDLTSYKAEVDRLHGELDRAEKAGLDIADLRTALHEIEKVRSGMLRVYGPTVTRKRVI
jgi:DNA repair exonuclease SbcCD ATPase subunit